VPIDIIMPQLGESIAEGTIVKWLVSPGGRVEKDQPLLEVETDKVALEERLILFCLRSSCPKVRLCRWAR